MGGLSSCCDGVRRAVQAHAAKKKARAGPARASTALKRGLDLPGVGRRAAVADRQRGLDQLVGAALHHEALDEARELDPRARGRRRSKRTGRDRWNGGGCIAEPDQALTIIPVRELATASQDGGGRMVAYRKSAEVVRFHLPMPKTFIQPRQKSLMGYEAGQIARTGGTEWRLPKAAAYADEVTAPPA